MRYLIICFFSLVYIFNSVAQVTQPARFEIEVANLNESYFTASAEENGLFIFKQNPVKSTLDDNIWEIIWLDTALQEVSKWELPINRTYRFKASAYSDNQLVMLFQSGIEYAENILFVNYTLKDENLKVYKYDNLVPIVISHFEKKEDAVIFGGKVKNQNKTVVKLFNFSYQKGTVLPGFYFYDRKSELHHINVNPANDHIKIITSEEQADKSLNIVTRSFSNIGNLIETNQIVGKTDYDLTSAYGSQNDVNNNVIAGTYSLNKPLLKSDGIFVSYFRDKSNNTNLNHHKFTDFEHFFSFLGVKRENRIKEKIASKKEKCKDLSLDYYIKIRNIISGRNQTIILAEAYTPEKYKGRVIDGYNDRFNNEPGLESRLGNGTSHPTSNIVKSRHFDSQGYSSIYRFDHLLPINNPNNIIRYQYSHAFIFGCDDDGNILWDNSIITENLTNRQLKNFVYAANFNDQMVLMYLNDQQIHSKVIRESTTIKDKTSEPLKLYNEADVLNNSISYFEGLKKWHNNTFYAYGVNSISNTKISVANERKVFFINKIVVE